MVVVVSSGNLGADSMLYAPGNDPFVITVGATDTNDTAATADDTLAPWSSYGTTQTGAVKPELVAPGRHIVSTIPSGSALALLAPAANVVENGAAGEYLRMNGTSFSAPQVTGAVAILLQEKPSLTPDQVKWILQTSARPVDGSTAGSLDLGAATALLASPQSANQSLRYSRWASLGWATNDFVTAVLPAVRAAAYERAAAVWTRQANVLATFAGNPNLRPLQARMLWARVAQAWERAASSWDDASEAWGEAAQPANASADATSAGNAWKSASTAWTSALVPDRAAAAWDRSAAAWDRAAAWDKAAAWDRAAAWDAAAWDRAAAWDAAAWD